MRPILSIVFITALLLWSCQKETLSVESLGGLLPPDSPGTAAPLLIKGVSVENGVTSIVEYGYDTSGRMIRARSYTIPAPNGTAQDTDTWLLYHYDATGRFNTLKRDLPKNNASFDTSDFLVQYVDNISSKVAFIKSHFTFNSRLYVDSLAYEYDGVGNAVKTTRYQYESAAPAVTKAVMYTARKYDGQGNLIQMQQYTPSSNAPDTISSDFKLSMTYQFQFDTAVNPLRLGAAFIEYEWASAVSPNNVVVAKNIYPTNAEPEELRYIYEYRPDGRPKTSRFTDGGQRTIETVYYYNK